MIADTTRFLLSNFTLTFLVLGFLVAAVSLLRAPRPLTAPIVIDQVFSYFLLFSVFCTYPYNAVFHNFFGDYAAQFIGWAQCGGSKRAGDLSPPAAAPR